VLHRVFAQIVVNSVDLALRERRADLAVERASRVEVMTKRLFDDHAPPLRHRPARLRSFSCQPRGGELLDDLSEKRRRHGKIKKAISFGAVSPVAPLGRLCEPLEGRLVLEPSLNIIQPLRKPLVPEPLVEMRADELPDFARQLLAKTLF